MSAIYKYRKLFGAKIGDKSTLKTDAEHWEAKIGPEWTKRLKRTRMYSGVKLKDLATSLGLNGAYDAAYFFMSNVAHGTDGTNYIKKDNLKPDIELKWYAEPEEVTRVLISGNSSMLTSAQLLDKRLGLGQEKTLDSFWQRISQTSR